ncbi:MAG: hypothetical protein JWN76_896 [Chitinophagaceae bacterium]|nr:hypothetical protein [Chitinophagaceae bacterium]
MSEANVNLSKEEMEAVTNPEWILTKNRVIDKVIVQFEDITGWYEKIMVDHNGLPEEVLATAPKISRGEKYRQLPYVMLDYPRIFTRPDVFAIRSFFWWGNFFSITLHLSGKYRSYLNTEEILVTDGWHIATGEEEWEHNIDSDHYRPLLQEDISDLKKRPFIKLTKKIPLHQWDFSTQFFIENFETILSKLITA